MARWGTLNRGASGDAVFTKSPRARLIEQVLRNQFPGSWAPLPIATLTDPRQRGPTPAERAAHKERLANIEAERKRLETLDDAELSAKVSSLEDAAIRRQKLQDELEEKRRLFNLPSASADFAYWVKADLWTLDEGIALLLGKDPRQVTKALVDLYGGKSPFARRFLELRMLAERSMLLNTSKSLHRKVEILKWAVDAQLEVPRGLLEALAARYADDTASEPAQPARDHTTAGQLPPEPSKPAPADPAPSGAAGVLRHLTKNRRRDAIDPHIELAQSKCRDATDTAQVWPELSALAHEEKAPFLGVFPEGLKYSKNGKAFFFKRDALDKRLHPEKRERRR